MPRPRVLCVAALPPATEGNGLAMRGGVFLEALASVADTELLLLPVFGDSGASSALIERLGVPVRVVPVAGRADTQLQLIARIDDPAERLRRFAAYGRGSRHAAISEAMLAEWRGDGAAWRYDLVHCQRLYLAPAAAAIGAPRLTLDLDEDDAAAWISGAAADDLARGWAAAEAAAEDRLLAQLRGRIDCCFVSSPADRASLPRRHEGFSAELLANGVAFPAVPARADDGRTLLFVGAYGYRPNAEGVAWFIEKVLPRLSDLAPRLVLVGPDMPEALRRLAARSDIEVRGRVAELDAVYAEATVALGPLLSGGGTRTKLIEAAAYGVPIVATPIAASGLDFLVGNGWIGEDANGFAEVLRAALDQPEERRRRAEAARAEARLRHDRGRIISALAERFARMLASPAAREAASRGHQ